MSEGRAMAVFPFDQPHGLEERERRRILLQYIEDIRVGPRHRRSCRLRRRYRRVFHPDLGVHSRNGRRRRVDVPTSWTKLFNDADIARKRSMTLAKRNSEV